ncbi:hypothetical protein ADILRU_0356 [Leifsonia rubra CMS 76R]|nr:hypothetical protein ADILRU_0356 [Leifsonia rubra CMS 76R]
MALGVMILGVAALAGAAPADQQYSPANVLPSGVDDFEFDSYDADFFLDRDSEGRSTLRTEETFVAVFPANQNQGMRRAIPDSYQGAPVDLSNISVTDETGTARPFEVETDEGFTLVTSAGDSFVDGAQTYVFRYEQSNVTRYFANTDADEWYWDTIGTGWDQRFRALGALLALVWAIRTRRTKLADAAGRPTIIAEYSPPRDLSVTTAALLLGKRGKVFAA